MEQARGKGGGAARAAGAALVLGAKVHEGGRASHALERRALHAARLYRDKKIARILASGGPPGAEPSEAEVIRRLCIDAGVKETHILIEPRARSTVENFRYSLPILVEAHLALAVIVTDRFHARRAALIARAHGAHAPVSCPPPTGATRWDMLKLHTREATARAAFHLRGY